MVQSAIEIRPYQTQDKSRIAELIDQAFGSGFVDMNLLEDERSYVWVAVKGDFLCGFILIRELTADEILQDLRLEESSAYDISKGAIILKTLVVDDNFHQRGIGHQLAQKCDELAVQKSLPLLCVSWIRKDGIPMEKINTKLGLNPLKRLEKYWEEESVLHKAYCPECGEPPCSCDAMIYGRPSS